MKSLAFVLVCAACTGEPGTDFPVEPASGGATTSGTDQVDTTVLLRGRVCVINDIFTRTCAQTGAANLNVQLANQTATTLNDGSFAITPTPGTGLSFVVSGAGVVTTSQALTPALRIPVLRQVQFNDMLAANGVVATAGTGSIFATVVRNGVPVQGVSATSTPSATFGPFFDGTAPAPWAFDATGARGIVWFPGITAGPVDLSFTTLTGGEATVGGVQVINGGVTMVESILP